LEKIKMKEKFLISRLYWEKKPVYMAASRHHRERYLRSLKGSDVNVYFEGGVLPEDPKKRGARGRKGLRRPSTNEREGT